MLVALVLCTFAPVVSAMAACQVHCAVDNEAPPAQAPSGHHERSDPGQGAPGDAWMLMQHLSHAGPCHLAAVPAAADTRPRPGCAPAARAWAPEQPARYGSFIPPPPEHRPRR